MAADDLIKLEFSFVSGGADRVAGLFWVNENGDEQKYADVHERGMLTQETLQAIDGCSRVRGRMMCSLRWLQLQSHRCSRFASISMVRRRNWCVQVEGAVSARRLGAKVQATSREAMMPPLQARLFTARRGRALGWCERAARVRARPAARFVCARALA